MQPDYLGEPTRPNLRLLPAQRVVGLKVVGMPGTSTSPRLWWALTAVERAMTSLDVFAWPATIRAAGQAGDRQQAANSSSFLRKGQPAPPRDCRRQGQRGGGVLDRPSLASTE